MAENETHVVYKALADFSALRKEALAAKKSVRDLRKEQALLNEQSDKIAKQKKTNSGTTKALKDEAAAWEEAASSAGKAAAETLAAGAAAKEAVKEQKALNAELPKGTRAQREYIRELGKNQNATERNTRSNEKFRRSLADVFREMRTGRGAMQNLGRGAENLNKSLNKLSNWRPRLIPPFIALVPVIGAVIAALNPLVALLGAVGGAAIGLAGNLGSLAGAALALPGIFFGIASGLGAMITAFGGVGSVFKAAEALRKGGGATGGASGPSPADQADALADAEERLVRSHRSVQRAQENLNEAREEALEDLIALRKEVSQNGLNEERAIANLQQAKEDYYRVMADPGSTLGDKLDAAASVKEAEQELKDVRDDAKKNVKELAEAEKKGVEGSDKVIDAQDRLKDAYKEQRDALKDLKKEQSGEGATAGGGGVDLLQQYNDALAELSPSAQKFVLGIMGMRDAWKALKREVQEAFFSEIVDDIDDLNAALPTLESLLKKAAGAMGRVVHEGIMLITSDPWKKDFELLGDSNVVIIENLGAAALSLLQAVKDIMVAAAPFTEWLTGALAEGAQNFEDLVANARETGDLGRWLDKVRQRLETWWGIIKNIGATLFNYSAAASEFGDWIAEGFLKITEGWKEASEEARKEDSPFKKWLEEIKEPLRLMKDLVGGFFGWFAKESMQQENIDDLEDLLTKIRDDLAPAVGAFLDKLAETDIDEHLVDALTSIVESVTEILDKGGNAGMETFFSVITGFFSAVADFLGDLDPGAADLLLKIIGAIAGLALITKFPGVSLLLSGITTLVGQKDALSKIFGWFKGLDKMTFKGVMGFLAKAGAAGLLAYGAVEQGGAVANTVDAAGKNIEAVNKGEKDWRQGLNDTAGEGLKGNAFGAGATAGLIDSIFGTDIKGAWSDIVDGWMGFIDEFQLGLGEWLEDPWAGMVAGFSNGWVQIEDWWNSLVGPEGSFSNGWTQIETWWNDLAGPEGSFATGWGQIETWWNDLVGPEGSFATGWAQIEKWWNESVIIPIRDGWAQIEVWWWENVILPIQRGWATVQSWWWQNVIIPIRDGWNQIKVWWYQNVILPIARGWATVQNWWWQNVILPISRGWSTIQRWWNETVTKAKGVWTTVQTWWNDAVNKAKGVWTDIQTKWNDFWGQFKTFDLAKVVSEAFGRWFGGGEKGDAPGGSNFSGIRGPNVMGPAARRASMLMPAGTRVTETLGSRAYDVANGVARSPNSYHYDAQNPAMDVAGPTPLLHEFYRRLVQAGGWRQILWQTAGHYDHVHVANTGGKVPGRGNGDSVKSLLTPGEFVVRKPIVQRIGADNLARLNSGVMSYQQLLKAGMANQNAMKNKRDSKEQLTYGLSGAVARLNGGGLAGVDGYRGPKGVSGPSFDFAGFGSSSQTVDQRTIIEKLEVNNPLAERASDSLPRNLRKVGYLGSGSRS